MITDFLMNYLAKAEGTNVHYNKNEQDITSPYGIYRQAHPTAKIFESIDNAARAIGLTSKSFQWQKADLDRLNDYLVINNLMANLRAQAQDFYDGYFAKFPLDKFPELCQVAVFSCYVNSPKLAARAVQEAINQLISNGLVSLQPLTADGIFGVGSTSALSAVVSFYIGSSRDRALYFESLILFNMSRAYAQLVVDNPTRNITYLRGWLNRLELLTRQ
jgi:hypothetical protein